jgi:hypothetical protein
VGDLLHKESSRSGPPERTSHLARRADPGRSLVGSGPCVLTRGSVYTTGPGTQDGVQSGTAGRGPRGAIERRRRTWTHSSTEGRSKGAHAVEFSKTVAPVREGGSFPRHGRNLRFRSGLASIAPAPPSWAAPGARIILPPPSPERWPGLCRPARDRPLEMGPSRDGVRSPSAGRDPPVADRGPGWPLWIQRRRESRRREGGGAPESS